MKTRCRTFSERKNLLDLPPEIFMIIEAYLEIHGIAKVLLTCKLIKKHIECFLYKVVYISKRSRNTNTRFFISLLQRRPEIIQWVHKLVIDEYAVGYFAPLLAFTFPNLENLIVQHLGRLSRQSCSWKKLNTLYSVVQPQPTLKNLTLSIEQNPTAVFADYQIYTLPSSAHTIFRHPQLKRMRLSYLDLTNFSHLPHDYFTHTNVSELFVERCRYTAANLLQLLTPCRNLAKLWLYQDQTLPFPPSDLPICLAPVKATLRVLKIVWAHLELPASTATTTATVADGESERDGMDFREFRQLHSLIIHPKFLFGRKYITSRDRDLSDLIISKLPPHLLIFSLEGIVPLWRHGTRSFPSPALAPEIRVGNPAPRRMVAGQGERVPAHDITLMRHILQRKDSVAPHLEWLTVSYLEHMRSLPEDVIDLAKERGVRCCELYEYDEIAPPRNMEEFVRGMWDGEGGLRAEMKWGMGERGYLLLDHRLTVPWPDKVMGNY